MPLCSYGDICNGENMEELVWTQRELYGRITRSYENLKKAGVVSLTLGLMEA